MKLSRWLSIVVVLTALLAAPGISLAQNFPSQGGGTTPSGPGGFPSQGGQQPSRGGFYQSPSFGFSLQFGAPWSLVEQFGSPSEGVEGVTVSNGASGVSFMGVNYSGTPQDLVQGVADGIGGMIFLTPLADEPENAAAFYVTEDGTVGARIQALIMSPSTAFVVVWIFPSDQVETEGAAYDLLLDGLQL